MPGLSVLALLGSLSAGAPGAQQPGWVRPEGLRRVLGTRLKLDFGHFELLKINSEEWTTPYISVDGTRVAVGSRDGRLRMLSLEDGALLWERKEFGAIGSSMVSFQGTLVLGSDSDLVGLDETLGEERWRLPVNGRVGGRIVLHGATALVPVRPNSMVSVNLETGKQQWRVKRPTPEGLSVRGQAAASVDGARNLVFVGFSDGAVMAVRAQSGEQVWLHELGGPRPFLADVDTSPVLVDKGQAIVVASYRKGLYRLRSETGERLWHQPEKNIHTMVAAGPRLMVAGTGDGQVIGLYAKDGRVRWRYQMKKGAVTEPVFLGRGQVAAGGTNGPVAILDVKTGRPVQLINPGSGVSAPVGWRDPDLVLLSNKGLFLALRYGVGIGVQP